MRVLRDSASAVTVNDPQIRDLIEQRFMDIATENEYDPDINGFMIVVEPFDGVEALEEKSGCPILRSYSGNAHFGDPGFRPAFECLEEHPACYEMVFVPGDGDFGIVIFVPKQPGIDAELLAFCATFAVAAP